MVIRAEVERILVEDDRARGVRLVDGRVIEAPRVVSSEAAAVRLAARRLRNSRRMYPAHT